MEGSPSSLGFVGFAFAEQAGDQIKEIQVDGGDGCVAPSADTISDGSYPLSRSLYIYVSNEAMARPEVKAYVDYYLTDDSLATDGLLEQVGYIALPADRIEATRSPGSRPRHDRTHARAPGPDGVAVRPRRACGPRDGRR